MIKINENFLELQNSYLFSTIAKKISEFQKENPDAKIIKLGIGDVTLPLAPVVIDESRNNNRNNNQNNAADNNAANNSNNAAIEESHNNEDEIAAGQEDVFEELEEESVPRDLIDLDEEEVPLDMAPFFEAEGSKSLSKAIKIALIIIIIAAMSLTGAFIVWKKRLASKVGLLNKAGKKEPKVKEKTEK